MNVTVSITGVEAVRERFARLEAATRGSVIAKTALELHDYIEREADRHTRTGALFRSVFQRRINENTYEIGHDLQIAPHAVFVHGGTKKHEIRPKAGRKALRYEKDGVFWFWFGPQDKKNRAIIFRWIKEKGYSKNTRVIFRWPVHPGNKPDKWLERAAAMAPRVFEKHLTAVIGKEK